MEGVGSDRRSGIRKCSVNLPAISDLKDVAILVGFVGTCAVLLWRMKAVEQRIKDQGQVIDILIQARSGTQQQLHDQGRRIGRLEDRVFDGRDRDS